MDVGQALASVAAAALPTGAAAGAAVAAATGAAAGAAAGSQPLATARGAAARPGARETEETRGGGEAYKRQRSNNDAAPGWAGDAQEEDEEAEMARMLQQAEALDTSPNRLYNRHTMHYCKACQSSGCA